MDKNIQIKDLGIYLKKEKIFVIGDVHLGFEESLSMQGILVPRFQLEETLKRLEKILFETDVSEVVITGDLKHEFGKILKTENRDALEFIDLLIKKYKLVIIRGNHDTVLSYIAQKRDIELKEYYKVNDIFICHGDRLFNNLDFFNSRTIIIGHQHPAISISNNNRVETFKCFLFGRYKNQDLIVMPSFNVLIEGTDILRGGIISPFLKQDLDDFEVHVIADRVYKFGKIKNLKLPSS